jgi:AcrR family transcriptional regulator
MVTPDGSSDARPVRRGPGSTTSALSRHGLRAHAEILAAAEVVFAERGYHGATIDAIGTASGRSGAAVYQYFRSKHDVFTALVEKIGVGLVEHAGSFPVLDQPQRGARELLPWLEALASVFEENRTVLLLWFEVEAVDERQQQGNRRFSDVFAHKLEPRITGLVSTEHQRETALAILAMADRSYTLREWVGLGCTRSKVTSALAWMIPSLLYSRGDQGAAFAPEVAHPKSVTTPDGAQHPTLPAHLVRTLKTEPGPRARQTIARVLDAAAFAFARNGLAGVTLTDIARLSGLKRESLYNYWRDQADLLATLQARAEPVILAQFRSLVELTGQPSASEESFRRWAHEYFAAFGDHSAVVQCAIDGADPPNLPAFRSALIKELRKVSRHRQHSAEVDETAMVLALLSLLVHLPHHATIFEPWLTWDSLEAVLAKFLVNNFSTGG